MQLRLRDETIYHLKQEIDSLKEEKYFTFEERIKELSSQLSLAPIKEAVSTVEEKPHVLVPVKKEPKVEAVTLIKTGLMSAQPHGMSIILVSFC